MAVLLLHNSPKSGAALHFCIHCMKSLNDFCVNPLFDISQTSLHYCLNSEVSGQRNLLYLIVVRSQDCS